MTTKPVASTTVVADALKTLKGQFSDAEVIKSVVSSWAIQTQELRTQIIAVLVGRMLSDAVGAQLDVLGKIVGEFRSGRSDAVYKSAIASKILRNRNIGTLNNIITILTSTKDVDFEITELYPASMYLYIKEPLTAEEGALFTEVFKRTKPGGVEIAVVWATFDPEASALTLASGDVEEYDEARGLANDALTTGGLCTEYKR